MKIRFFGSSKCEDCSKVFVILEKFQIDYDYVDGHDESDDIAYSMCEDNNVEELPHLQFVDEYNTVVHNHIGPLTEDAFSLYLELYFPKH